VAVGVCADAIVASSAVAAKATVRVLANMGFLPGEIYREKTRCRCRRSVVPEI
jgi:hypothetical protein